MKYYNCVKELEKEASVGFVAKAGAKIGQKAVGAVKTIANPKKAWSSMSTGKKLAAGAGAVTTGVAVGGSAIDSGKELMKPINTAGTSAGFQNGTMQVNPDINKVASSSHDDLEISKMKYMPHAAALTGAGLVGVGVAQGRVNKDLLVREGKRAFKKVSKGYAAASQVVNEANNIAKKTKMNKDMKEAMSKYIKESGNVHIDLDAFKELNSEYSRWVKRTGNMKNISFEDWAKRNAGKTGGNSSKSNNFNGNQGKKRTPFIELAKQKVNTGLDAAIAGTAFSGAATAANFVGHEIGDEYFKRKDKDEVRKRFREDWNNNMADHIVKGKPLKKGRSTGYKTPKEKVDAYNNKHNNNKHNNNKSYKPKYIQKHAAAPMGDFVNHADDVINGAKKVGEKLKGKALVKDVIKNDVVKSATNGIAYVGAPALVANALKRDRNTGKKLDNAKTDKVVMEIPDVAMSKKASYKKAIINGAKKVKSDYIPDNIGQEFVRSGIRGVSMAAPVALIASKTNRNLRGNMEKLEDKNKALKPVEKGNVRITMERRLD